MFELLQDYDRNAMVVLNAGDLHNPSTNFFFWMISQILIWSPVLVMFFYTIAHSKGKETLLIAGFTILLFTLCDQVSSSILKPLIARPRPSHDPIIETLLNYVNNYRGGAYGFPSSHAANSFGFAIFSSLLFREKYYTIGAISWACMCSYSRIYLGVHFPGDIIVGIILGIAIGFLCHWLYYKSRGRFALNNTSHYETEDRVTATGYKKQDIYLILYTLIILLFAIICCSLQTR